MPYQAKDLALISQTTGLKILGDTATHKARMEIKSESSNRLYLVSFRPSLQQWECSCPAWCMKKAGKPRGCKHLKNMLPALEQIQTILKLG